MVMPLLIMVARSKIERNLKFVFGLTVSLVESRWITVILTETKLGA